MVKKKEEGEIIFDTPDVAEIVEAPKKEKKIKGIVHAIVKGNLIIRDEKGNGYRILITKEYRNVKIGDSISF
jgi:hypothetical protein